MQSIGPILGLVQTLRGMLFRAGFSDEDYRKLDRAARIMSKRLKKMRREAQKNQLALPLTDDDGLPYESQRITPLNPVRHVEPF